MIRIWPIISCSRAPQTRTFLQIIKKHLLTNKEYSMKIFQKVLSLNFLLITSWSIIVSYLKLFHNQIYSLFNRIKQAKIQYNSWLKIQNLASWLFTNRCKPRGCRLFLQFQVKSIKLNLKPQLFHKFKIYHIQNKDWLTRRYNNWEIST